MVWSRGKLPENFRYGEIPVWGGGKYILRRDKFLLRALLGLVNVTMSKEHTKLMLAKDHMFLIVNGYYYRVHNLLVAMHCRIVIVTI